MKNSAECDIQESCADRSWPDLNLIQMLSGGPMIARTFLFAILVSAPGAALAELEFCNSTDDVASVAIGYKGPQGWTSEGWWNVDPGDCTVAIRGDLPLTHYYYRVVSPSWTFDHERYMFCTSQRVFTIVGDTECEARGHAREGFNEIALEGRSAFTVEIGGGAPEREDDRLPSLFDDLLDTSPQVESDPPGTHGDFKTLSGLFSHCADFGDEIVCFFTTQGWVIGVAESGPTPLPIILDLEDRPVNTPMQFSGDVFEEYDGRALMALSDYMVTSPDEYAADRAAMQGVWEDVEGSAGRLDVFGSFLTQIYPDGQTDINVMHFRQGCPGSGGDGVALRLTPDDPADDEQCAFLSYVDGDELDLLYVDTTGSGAAPVPISYRRAR
ncbi:DUF1036 domain-containing protein [Maritimibacter sp. UBA3975]|uniref:DUF1036 domain-containing protein n=1 Tax=Maritimibacter sp. UBA3975 TaxID=1946833 RepID=UPI0025C2E824|nr:DUF1036 domain-containing protein [Maritimibacter sp. UBA3975]